MKRRTIRVMPLPADSGKMILGVTGGFGTGKSTVSRMFKELGAKIIDADKIAHRMLYSGTPAYKKIVSRFGKGILKKDGSIDRRILGEIAFAKKSRIRDLCRIVHPPVIAEIRKKIKSSKCNVILIDAPLLIEAGLLKSVDMFIVVKADRKKQIERIEKRMKLSKKEILKRIDYQLELKDKIKMADHVIDNSKTMANTKKQVKYIWNGITERRKR